MLGTLVRLLWLLHHLFGGVIGPERVNPAVVAGGGQTLQGGNGLLITCCCPWIPPLDLIHALYNLNINYLNNMSTNNNSSSANNNSNR